MQEFDVIVIGAGSGLTISSAAAAMGKKVAIVERGPLGGTCLNRGCIPSKIIIHAADVAETIKQAATFGIFSSRPRVNMHMVTARASRIVDTDAQDIEESIKEDRNTTLFKCLAHFTGKRELQVGKKKIKGKKIVIAAGSRPFLPPIRGLDAVPYLTSKEALRLSKLPKTLTMIGGGYIAAEMAHFFSAMGSKVTIIQRDELMIPREDREIARHFTAIFKKRCNVITNAMATDVEMKKRKVVTHYHCNNKGRKKSVTADKIMLAVGRVPNSDLLKVENSDVRTNKRGFIETNEYMETSQKNIWALGDIAGKWMFKHSANLEANYVYHNMFSKKKLKVDYTAMPHAVFSSPQISGVGKTEEQLQAEEVDYVAGKYDYDKTGMGIALNDRDGFVKILADRKTRKILGCFIIGTDASTLIHEVLVAMKADQPVDILEQTVHIHPALSEVVQRAVHAIEW